MSKRAKQNDGFVFTVAEEKGDVVTIEVSEADYLREKAAGVAEEFLLKPGRHEFIRGGFLKRHPDFLTSGPHETFVNVTLRLKLEVFNYYEQRAAELPAGSSQALMTEVLQQAVQHSSGTASLQTHAFLLNDERFIAAVAERVKKLPAARKTSARKSRRQTKTSVKAKAA
jgi:hypothetical protein